MATMAANMYTGGAFGSVMGGMAGTGFAFGSLLTELGVEQSADQDVQKSLDRIDSLQSQMNSFKDSGVRMKSLGEDLRKTKTLEDRLRILRTMIQVSKSLASMMSGSPELGERAFKVQDIRLNYMILDELMAMRRLQYEQSLREREKEARLGIAIAAVTTEESAARKRVSR
ncbi:MAG: hypothetical protein EOP05_04605 [Proteobacteria bacterium]|nr:MAG: hypothetical protein EOP05_04605 [Pseudomonadota bacterium]